MSSASSTPSNAAAARDGRRTDTADFDRIIPRTGTASMKWERYRDRDVLPFWVADMDFEVAEPIRAALAERLSHPVFGYTVAPDGMAPAVQDHLRREFDWEVDADWLVWLPGVVPGLAASCRAFCADGDEILVNPPIYQHFFDSHDEPRQTLLRVPLRRDAAGRWSWDIEAMRAACTPRTRLLMLCSPHNPTGTVFTQSELDALAELALEKDLIVVSDEIHCDLVIDPLARHRPTARACPSIADRSVTLMSGSKTWNIAGLNCSFAIVPDPAMRERFAAACRTLLPMVPPLAYVATEAAYREGGGLAQGAAGLPARQLRADPRHAGGRAGAAPGAAAGHLPGLDRYQRPAVGGHARHAGGARHRAVRWRAGSSSRATCGSTSPARARPCRPGSIDWSARSSGCARRPDAPPGHIWTILHAGPCTAASRGSMDVHAFDTSSRR